MLKQTVSTGVLLCTLLLGGCGGSDNKIGGTEPGNNGQTPTPQPAEPGQNALNRLLILNDDNERPELSLFDLDEHVFIDRVQLAAVPSALYSSPQYRYGVILDRVNGQVSFYDAGPLAQSGQAGSKPQLLSYHWSGAAPTHYRVFNGQAAIFYDGNAAQTASFAVFKDLDIASNWAARQNLPYQHHGVAEPRGDYVLSSYMTQGEEKLSVVKSYGQHGDHYHVSQTLQNSCPGLHGAASIQHHTAFGCEDGVLLVEQQGSQFIDLKLPTAQRISTVIGHDNAKVLVGLNSASSDLYIVDPSKAEVQRLAWAAAGIQRIAQSFSSSGKYFVILDSLGRLNILDAQTWELKHQDQLFEANAPALKKAQLVNHGSQELLYINDVQGYRVIEVNLDNGNIRYINLSDTVPEKIIWLGTPS